jgi:hypothetical protein
MVGSGVCIAMGLAFLGWYIWSVIVEDRVPIIVGLVGVVALVYGGLECIRGVRVRRAFGSATEA